MRFLAIDYGLKRTGLAICDRAETICSPLSVLQGLNNDLLVRKIRQVIEAENIEAILIGLPLNMDDSLGGQAKIVQKFADTLEKSVDIPIHFQDERLSSFAAEERIAAAEYTRKKKKKRLDAIAAAQILEAFLEQRKTQ